MIIAILTPVLAYLICIGAIYGDSLQNISFTDIDYAVVFGNKVETTGEPSNRLRARLDRAFELWSDSIVDTIIVSGGIGIEGFDEAKVMGQYLLDLGVDSTLILFDNEGVTTHATAQYCREMISSEKSVVVVTQQFHISRAKLSLRNAGFSEVYGAFPQFRERRDLYSSIREVPALFKYWIKEL